MPVVKRTRRIASKKDFDPRSFRTVARKGGRVVIGCPKGHWDPRRKKCRVGTRAQRVYSYSSKKKKNPFVEVSGVTKAGRPVRSTKFPLTPTGKRSALGFIKGLRGASFRVTAKNPGVRYHTKAAKYHDPAKWPTQDSRYIEGHRDAHLEALAASRDKFVRGLHMQRHFRINPSVMQCPRCKGTHIQRGVGYKLHQCLSCYAAFDTASAKRKRIRVRKNPLLQVLNPPCRQCGGPLVKLGGLGQLIWYRCRNCGWEVSRKVRKSRKNPCGRYHRAQANRAAAAKRRFKPRSPSAIYYSGKRAAHLESAKKRNPGAAWHRSQARQHLADVRKHGRKGQRGPALGHRYAVAAHCYSAAESKALGMRNPPIAGIPISHFRDPEFRAQYEKAVRQYYQQHGVMPTRAKRIVLPVGGRRITDHTVLVAMGKTPAETYQPHVRSKKGRGQAYKHDYHKMPVKAVDPSGKLIMTLPGSHGVKPDGWIHG